MTKHLSIQKLLATLLTIVAVLAGQQAFATITSPMSLTGNSALMNGQYYHVWKTEGFLGYFPQPRTEGSSYTFNGQNIGLQGGDVRITGTLNFTESNDFTDVTTGSTVTVEFYSTNFWFFSAEVKKLDGTSVSGCSYSASSDHTSITITIPSGKTFGNIYLDFVAYEPFYNYNTTISGVEAEYIYTGRPIEPVPTVTYNGTVLTAGTDYTVSYSNTTGPGSASVTVTGTGQYAGTVTRNYNIRAVALTDFTSLGNNTYAIATTADLDHLAGYVNLGNECQGLTFKQTANITFTHSDDWDNSSSTENNYTAIGTEGNPFQGTYDGQNHTISGIRIYKGGTSNSDKRQGIFGAVSTDGTVKRVNLADARITGCDEVGGIVGMTFEATIEDCTVGADVCIHAVKSSTYSHGGIVGFNESAVRRCISRATLTVKNGLTGCNRYGGIVGFNNNSGTVTDCIAVGAVIPDVEGRGAIVGYNNYNSTLIRNYYRDCKVASNNVTPSGVGMGTSQSGTTTSDVDGAQPLFALTLGTNVTLERTAEATLPGTNNKTYANGADIAGVHYAYPTATVTLGYSGTVPAGQTPLYSVDGTAIWGNTFTMPTADCTVSVEIVDGWSGSGTQSDPYVITTTAQLDALAAAVKSGETYSGTYFVLGNDIAYSTAGLGDTDENFTTIGGYFNGGDKNFSGTFDGQGHTISGIRLYKTGNSNPSKNQGLFGRIDGATIKNVILTDARITGYRYVGGIVGNKASGTVQNCLVLESTITCENTYVGALFGGNSGTITANHYHGCTVNGTANATNVGVGGNGGTSSSSDKNGARSAHILTLGENVTATGESVTYQGTTYYASTTTVTLGYDNLPAGYTVTYSFNGTALAGNTFTMPANDNATVDASTALITYNITYDLDGGNVATANPTTYNVTTPTFTLNNPTKVACNFDGWTGSNGDTPETTVTIAQGSTGDRSYTAHWTQYAFTLTLGTNITASGTVAFTLDGTDYYAPGTEITLAYGGTIPEGYRPLYSVNGTAIVGNTFEMPTADVVVDAVLLERYYTFNSTTGVLALLWGEFNKDNKWGSEVTESAVTSVTATSDVSFTGNCYNLFYNFTNCTSMELGNVNTDALNNMSCMFWGCSSLTTLDLSGWNTANVTNMSYMFSRSTSLQSLDLSGWNTANVTNMSYMFSRSTSLQSLDLSGWNTDNVTNMSNMFYYCESLQSLNLSGWNTDNVTNMQHLFYVCSGLQSLNVSGWNTANVTNMQHMFDGCSGLQSLDLSGWNTANVTNMNTMFLNCTNLATIYVGEGWNTSGVTSSNYMFSGCTSLVGGMGTTYDADHTGGEYAHIDGGPDNPGYLSRLRYTFNSTTGVLALLFGEFNKDNKWGNDVDPSAVTSVTATDEVSFTGDCSELFSNFTNCTSMDLGNVNTDALNNTFRMFDKCLSLLSLEGISDWDVSNVTNMIAMFRDCWSLSSLDLSDWNTANVTNMSSMFAGSGSLTTIYVGTGWNTESVTSTSYMFDDCSSLTTIDLSGWSTANVTNMIAMFRDCWSLSSLDLSDWNTANVTNMSYMFEGCSGLQSLNVSGWNTANVTNMSYMFHGCSGLQSLNVSGWNTANVTDMSGMFWNCSGLQSLDLSGWNTAKVTDMSVMFYSCSGLQSLNVSGWNTANVTDMCVMFEDCSGLQSLDLSGWNTAKVTDMSNMFRNCTNLATIYVGGGWSTSRVNWSNDMFSGCTSLVGGMGTHYILFHTDKEYARIDRGSERRGYFTAPFTKEIAGYEDNESGWYLIASPLAADIAPTAVTNMTNETFDLYYFDQTGGNNGKEWKNWKNEGGDGYHFNLEAGKGYLYANSGDVTLMFAGTPYDGDGVVNLTYSTDNPNATMHGWNLIGNPFSTNATIGDTPFYRMNAAGSEIIAADVNDNTVNPMEGIFVKATQANQTVTFETAMTRGNANSNSAALVMDISQNRGGVIDRAIVRFDEGQTLPKFQIHENSTKVYIPQDGKEYAIVSIGNTGEMPLNFKAKENGTYTLTISPTLNSKLSTLNYLHLIDNLTGADVDLLQTPEYTFTAKTTDYASRFKLMFSINQEDGPSTGSGTFAFISNGNLIVNGTGTLQVIDMTGRVLYTAEANSAFRIQHSAFPTPGVYVLRLINGNDVKVQKMVVE